VVRVRVRHEDRAGRVARVEVEVRRRKVESVARQADEGIGRDVRWQRRAHVPSFLPPDAAVSLPSAARRCRLPGPPSVPRLRTPPSVWSDTLLAAEREHLLRLIVWGVASVLIGLALVGLLRMRRTHAPLLSHFALQSAAWGAINVALASWAWRGLAPRDFARATALDRLLWLNLGLDVGYVGVGIAIVVTGWVLGRRLGLVGAGLGVVVQGLALFILDILFVSVLGRLTFHG
jgi:hypothetical protein